MAAVPASAQRSSVDHGVQIRFIDDLRDAGGGLPAAATPSSSSSATKKTRTTKAQAARYGVAIRVQGIHGQPYVVLKDGGVNGDSYGVQLRTQYPPAYGSLPGRGRGRGAEPGGGGQPRPAEEGEGLRRAHSHGSLLDTETGDVQGGPGSGEEGPTTQHPLSGSHGNLDRVGVVQSRSSWDDETSYQNQINSSLGPSQRGPPGRHQSLHDLPPAPTHPCPVPAHTNRWERGAVPGHPQDIGDASPVLTPNPYSSPPSSTHSSLGRGIQGPVPSSANKAAPPGRYVAVEKTPSANQTGRYVAVETPSTNQTETWVTPDLLLDQGQSSELSSEEGEVMNTIYGLVRGGTNEGEDVVKHKVQIIFQRIQRLMGCSGQSQSEVSLKAQLDSSLDENLQLLERLDHSRAELHRAHEELSQLRMERENAESTVRQMEDRLSELQEDARRDGDNKTELASCQAELSACGQRGRRAEEALRQRERELTALKGALKDEVESHDKEMEALREQYSTDMERLRGSMEALSQSQAGIEAERQRVNTSVRSLHQQLDDCRDESSQWMEQFHTARDQQRSTKQELLQARLEKEEFEEELKELQEKLNTVQQHTPDPTHTDGLNKEVERCRAELEKLKAETDRKVLDLKAETDRKVLELIHAKKARQEQEAELKYEIDRLINQLQRAKEEVAKAQDKNKKLLEPAVMSELEAKLAESRDELGLLRDKLSSGEAELDTSKMLCSSAHTELKEARDMQREQEKSNARLRDKISSLETQLQASATENSEAELSLHTELRALKAELDDTKRRASRLDQEHYETGLRREEAEKERDTLRQAAAQLEESRRQHDRVLEKLRNEYGSLSVSSGEEAQALRAQLEEQRERARKETQETQRHGAEMQTSLERNTHSLRRLEEEVSRQKKELSLACEERDNHQLDKELLTNRLRHLEAELENSRSGLGDRAREVRSLEDKLKRVEAELEEERSSVEMLTDRVNRSRDQMDSLRSELMTERSSKQDLELDKNALERHLKELRVRLADMEGQSRPSAGVTQLESKVQELLERLTNEEREKNTVLASQRRLERKLKDVNMALDEERHQQSEQRDQLSLRVKALKRQVDEGESELERMDGLRRKSQREAEEQAEQKEALQTRVTALENELKRKVQTMRRSALDSSALSSEDEDDDLYDTSTITSILTESNLQTSSC